MAARQQLPLRILALGFTVLVSSPAPAAPAEAANQAPRVERVLPAQAVRVLGSAAVDLAELARREARIPASARPPLRVLLRNERNGEEGIEQPDEPGFPAPARFSVQRTLSAPSPSPSASFAGLDDIAMVDSSYILIPPDVNGAVGPTRIFQNLNNNVRVLEKSTGAVLATVGVNTWWGPTGATPNDYTDPRSTYDPYNQRFITIMQGDLSVAAGNTICLGLSDTDDPLGTWHLYRFLAYENNTYDYADFPTLGFNRNWITISINMYNFSQTQVRRSVFAVHYPTLRDSHTATVYRADYATSGVICGAPCVTLSATCDTEYVIQRRGTSTYAVDMITGTGPGAPTYTVGAALTRPGGAWSALGTSNWFPQSAPVSGSSVCSTPCPIERIDDNVRTSPVYRGGSIWFAQNVGLPASSMTHAAVQWTQITTPSGAFVVGGRLQDTLATTSNGRPHYGFPSIAVNAAGDFILGFTRFGSSQHPAAGYAMHLAADGVGTLRDTVVYRGGDDYYHKTFTTNTGRNRWGDFSTCQVDPADDGTLWTVQEYAKARTSTDDGTTGANGSKWGTWWAAIAPAGFTITASAGAGGTITPSGVVTVPPGGDQTFTIAPDSCHHVTDVLVDGVSQGPLTSYPFTNVQANHTISASFAIDVETITASAGGGGAISPAGEVAVDCGGSQTFTVQPDTCHVVADVVVDGVSQGAVTSYPFTNVRADHTIAASFTRRTFTVTATAGSGGTIVPSGAVPVDCAADQTFHIAPDAADHVLDVRVDGVSVGAETTYTFHDVTAAHTIAASFSANTYTVTTTATGRGGVSRNPDQGAYDYGSSVELTPVPDLGWAFAGWSGDTVTTATPLVLFVIHNWAVTAAFADVAPPAVQVTYPTGGEAIAVGATTNVTWSATDNEVVAAVDLFLSRAGAGGPFDTLATGLANSGSWSWTVTGPATTNAFVKVAARDSASNSAFALSDSAFTVLESNAVESVPVTEFALAAVWPNPSHGRCRVAFALPRDAAVRIGVLDVLGREVAVLAAGETTAGRHEVAWEAAAARPGLYFVRMQAGGRTFLRRIVMIR